MTDLGRDQLLNLDRQLFLARYWQREPLLIKNAIVDFRTPISSHELAGLALEDAVESRLIEHCDSSWRLLHGPFTESDFLRKSPWTLLVQAVDHYIPEVAALRKLMDFIPQWRVDDVMVSYAVAGGSVGPHYDNYDVFLLQGEGSRRWQLGQFCDETSALVPHESLRILRDFVPREEYLVTCCTCHLESLIGGSLRPNARQSLSGFVLRGFKTCSRAGSMSCSKRCNRISSIAMTKERPLRALGK